MKFSSLLGKRFGKLTVLNLCRSKTKYGQSIWHCICDCGNQKDVVGVNLVSGNTKSCGCLFNLIHHKQNKMVTDNSSVYIYLNKSNNPAIIDLDDYDKVKDFYWDVNDGNYVYTRKTKNRKTIRIFLHRLIMPIFDDNLFIDHINGNPLDNRKCNLRVVTIQQNCCNRKKQINNTTGHTGVTMNRGKFLAFLTQNHKNIHLGYYDNLEDAVKAREDAEIRYFGEYRRQ